MVNKNTVPKQDRRIQRTRQLLRDALMSLIAERGYENVSVADIADRANLARTTFYLHYRDKDELLFNGVRDLYDELLVNTPRLMDKQMREDWQLADPSDFDHVERHADFYRVMVDERGSIKFLLQVSEYLAATFSTYIFPALLRRGQTPRLPIELMGYTAAWMQIGVVRWWLHTDKMQHSSQEVAQMMHELCLNGMLWATRNDDLPLPAESRLVTEAKGS